MNFVTFFFSANTFTHSSSIQHQLWFKAKDHFQTFSFHCSSKPLLENAAPSPLCKSHPFFFLLFSCLDTPCRGHIVLHSHRCSVFLHVAKPNCCFGEAIQIASSRPHLAMWALHIDKLKVFSVLWGVWSVFVYAICILGFESLLSMFMHSASSTNYTPSSAFPP